MVLLPLAACTLGSDEGKRNHGDRADCGDVVGLAPHLGGQTFKSPTVLLQHPDNPSRWYVGEQAGVIFTALDVSNGSESAPTRAVFVDLTDRVDSNADEAGLLGMAFHPDFESNGFVFISYTATSSSAPAGIESRISRFFSPDHGRTLDKSSERRLLQIDQPFVNHNGGHIAFGPDGKLYIGFGDGGSANDPLNNSQNPGQLLGKMLRLDVDVGTPFGIPSDNPFVVAGGRPEIWAVGLRNPWRFSFDSQTGDLWVADVGQGALEEIDVIERGGNYGWPLREGTACGAGPSCGQGQDLILPVAEYNHDLGISVIGGYVYRGSAIPGLRGKYLFADFATGNFFAIPAQPGMATVRDPAPLFKAKVNPSTFAQDADGEVYFADFTSGVIVKIVAPDECTPLSESAPQPSPSFTAQPLTFQSVYDDILSVQCSPCHTQRALGGLAMPNADAAFSALVGASAATDDCAGRKRVVPGQPQNSVLFQKLSGVNLCGPEMPPFGPLSSSDLSFIQRWIAAGARR